MNDTINEKDYFLLLLVMPLEPNLDSIGSFSQIHRRTKHQLEIKMI